MLQRLRRLFRLFSRDAVMLWHACRHPDAPKRVRIGAVLLVLYLISPIDLIPDTFLLFGWMDDVTLACFLMPVLLRFLPQRVKVDAAVAADRTMSRWGFGLRRP
ncbi:MAG TPA: DUF1232 domain-containing protein [Oxalicibacterium sp.]|jgi:uncharacterized membrane protein YkvA (DUF1232 family)|nr:DUF1232 domain-containing protein [Oxalicibacterium sp.]